jgi:hypothetical protein
MTSNTNGVPTSRNKCAAGLCELFTRGNVCRLLCIREQFFTGQVVLLPDWAGLGSQSVIVFFVLSGFFVGESVIKRWNIFSYSDYLLAWFIRLWIVLVPALLLTLFLDQYTSRIAPNVSSGFDFGIINLCSKI